ncbi:MAG: hypothetical protein JKY34_12815 [Kordiimonadaceae bacterium]|nr:hypothetical protein [Kordiimonadaceae bacterium]
MKRILGWALVAGVVVAGVAGCAAPKKSGQAAKPISHLASSGTGSQLSNQAKPSASKLVKQEKARAAGKLELARVLSSKEALHNEMAELGTCAGFFTALADMEKRTGVTTGMKPGVLFVQYIIGGSYLATKYASVEDAANPDAEKIRASMAVIQKMNDTAKATYVVLLKSPKDNAVALASQVKTCGTKSPLLTYVWSQMKPVKSK